MDQIVEMGKTKTSCGRFGCGEVEVSEGKHGTRCRSLETNLFVPCPPEVSRGMGDVGFFVKKDAPTGKGSLPWGRLPGTDWGVISTPNLRRPFDTTAKTMYHALKQPGVEKYEARFPGRVQRLFTGPDFDRSAADLAAQRRIEAMMRQTELPGSRWGGFRTSGIGRYGRMGAYYPPFRVGASWGPFDFDPSRAMALRSPLMIQPHQLVLGNLAGSFAPGLVTYAVENVAMPDLARSALRFGLAASGAFLVLFGRQNGYLLGAGLALLPQTVSAIVNLGKGLMASNAAQPPAQAGAPEASMEGVGQWTPSEKAALQKESMRTFGVNVQGAARRLGFNRGFEVVVPDDFGDLSRGSVQVAKAVQGLGNNPFKPLGS